MLSGPIWYCGRLLGLIFKPKHTISIIKTETKKLEADELSKHSGSRFFYSTIGGITTFSVFYQIYLGVSLPTAVTKVYSLGYFLALIFVTPLISIILCRNEKKVTENTIVHGISLMISMSTIISVIAGNLLLNSAYKDNVEFVLGGTMSLIIIYMVLHLPVFFYFTFKHAATDRHPVLKSLAATFITLIIFFIFGSAILAAGYGLPEIS